MAAAAVEEQRPVDGLTAPVTSSSASSSPSSSPSSAPSPSASSPSSVHPHGGGDERQRRSAAAAELCAVPRAVLGQVLPRLLRRGGASHHSPRVPPRRPRGRRLLQVRPTAAHGREAAQKSPCNTATHRSPPLHCPAAPHLLASLSSLCGVPGGDAPSCVHHDAGRTRTLQAVRSGSVTAAATQPLPPLQSRQLRPHPTATSARSAPPSQAVVCCV